MLSAAGVSLLLYGIAGFPGADQIVTDPAGAHPVRGCVDNFWNSGRTVCWNSPHTHKSPSSIVVTPTTTKPPAPTTTAKPTPTTTVRSGGSDNQRSSGGGSDDQRGGGNSRRDTKGDSQACGVNAEPDSNGGCRTVYGDPSRCTGGQRYDSQSQLCINPKGQRADLDVEAKGVSHTYCESAKEWNVGGRCVVKLRKDDPERSKNCRAGQVFYSSLGCANPCDAGQTVVGGSCVTVRHTPPPPQNPQNPPPAAECPPGYTGTPPNCTQLPNPTAYVTIAGAGTVDEDAGPVTVTVTLSSPATKAATVALSTADGTAAAGEDYTSLTTSTGAVQFAAGDQQKQARVTLIDDTAHETDETFTVSVTSASGGAQLPPEGSSVEATIVDNDPAAYVTAAGDLVVDEDVGTVAVTVTLSHPATAAATVTLATANGSAAAGADYTPLTAQNGTVQFAAGDKQKQLTAIVIIDDETDEPDETFTVSVASASGGAQAPLGGSSVEFTIVDNDPTPLAAANFTAECGPDAAGRLHIQFLWDPPPEAEDGGRGLSYNLQVGYSLDRYDNAQVTPRREWRNADGRAVGGFNTADRASDGTMTPWNAYRNGFEAGRTVHATVIPGRYVEKTIEKLINGELETFSYSELDYSYNNLAYASAVCPTRPTVSLSPAALTVNESDAAAALTVSLSHPWPVDVAVDVSTADAEAIAGADYTAPAAKAVIAAGEADVMVSVPVIDDADEEPAQTFAVSISAPAGGAVLGSAAAVVTITDNDSCDTGEHRHNSDPDADAPYCHDSGHMIRPMCAADKAITWKEHRGGGHVDTVIAACPKPDSGTQLIGPAGRVLSLTVTAADAAADNPREFRVYTTNGGCHNTDPVPGGCAVPAVHYHPAPQATAAACQGTLTGTGNDIVLEFTSAQPQTVYLCTIIDLDHGVLDRLLTVTVQDAHPLRGHISETYTATVEPPSRGVQ